MKRKVNNNHEPVFNSNARFIQNRGSGSSTKRRPYFFRTGSNMGKRSRTNIPSVFPQVAGLSDVLHRTELFAAPLNHDDQQLQVIFITNPTQYVGWRLYFPKTNFTESSALISQIKAFEHHVKKHPTAYDLSDIIQQRWFNVYADFILKDDEFCSSWNNFAVQLKESPYIVLSCLGVAMHQIVTNIIIESSTRTDNPSFVEYRRKKFNLPKINARPVGFFPVTRIADLTVDFYDKLIVVHGHVTCITSEDTTCTSVAYKCKCCDQEQAILQTDIYPIKPLRCRIQCNSKRNFVELRSSSYTKIECVQMIQLQEIRLQDKKNSIYIDVELREDLVDKIYPGLEVAVMGVLKMKPLNQNNEKGFKQTFYLQAVSLLTQKKLKNLLFLEETQKDIEIVQIINKEEKCFRLLVHSLAPEMCGYEMAKVAVLLSLFGGNESQQDDEGELNVLLVGDPGLDKTDMLKNAASISQRGNLVSVKAPTNFMPALQNASNFISTGSILSTHTGHCCIDDMGKLSPNQENLIHVMQTKSISSRSQNIMFNVFVRTSMITSVNPFGGHYDSSKLLRENVRLIPPFLSLFHLVFVLYDKADKDRDNILTEHIKALHSGKKNILLIPPKFNTKFKSSDHVLQNEEIALNEELKVKAEEKLDLLPTVLLRKYVDYARRNIKPLLKEEAANKIKEYYMGLRSEKNEEERFSVTTRQLEGLILLTQARARAELCFEATKKHACDIIELVRNSYTSTSVEDRLDTNLNSSVAGTSHGSQVKKFIQMLQLRSNALGKKIFEFEELKDMATHIGIRCGVSNLVDLVNMQGYLLKKGPNLYEVRIQ